MNNSQKMKIHFMTSTEEDEIRKRMRKGVCKFKYMKVNGDERIALGTLNGSFIDSALKQLGADPSLSKQEKEPNDSVFRYFDLNKNAFRGFAKARFMGICAYGK